MTVETDFSYLKSLASRPEDTAKLDDIAEDRRRIRFEDAIISDTRFMDIRLGGLTFHLRRDLAPGSVDSYIEIFRDKAHMKLPEFYPENNRSVIDAGANEGFYALYMKSRNPNIRIICAEPVPAVYDILTRNIQANGYSGIQTVKAALSHQNGTGVWETYPHVSSVSAEDLSRIRQPWIKRDRIRSVPVRKITLETLFQNQNLDDADLLKIDTEGSEAQVLMGSESMLKRIRKIVVEWHTPELREQCTRILQNHDFKLIHQERRRPGDSYFINSAHPSG